MNNDTRVILGTVFFLGLVLMVGWVAFNEQGRMSEFTTQYEGRSVERGATIFESNCSTCHGQQGQGIPGRAPALNHPRLFNGECIAEMGWTSTLEDYIQNAVAGGRPNSGSYWNGNVMPSWGQEFGGPLRPDQVLDVSRYIMNWESRALDEENPPLVLQDFILPGLPGAETEGSVEPAEGGTGEIVDLLAALPEGNASNGATLYTNLGCVGCHLNGAIAPMTQGTSERVQQRLAAAPELEGYSPEQYILESIIMPNAYIVPDSPSYMDGNGNSLMPGTYRDLVDDQGLADLLAYLLTH